MRYLPFEDTPTFINSLEASDSDLGDKKISDSDIEIMEEV